jgi:hypothetical protein
LALLCAAFATAAGCRYPRPGSGSAPSPHPPVGSARGASWLPPRGPAPLVLRVPAPQLAEMVVEAQRKRVAGRRTSLEDVARVADEDAPLVAAAAGQPAAQAALGQVARETGMTVDEATRLWVALQEADLLLESGGNPEDASPAHAVGVAQWIPGTARRAGLRIDLAASDRLTAGIDSLKRRVAWMEYLSRGPAGLAAPGAPGLSPEQAAAELPAARARLESLRAARRAVDPRYDPGPAIGAQASYLLGLYARFPSLDWVFQGFHGGEAGVTRTLKRYLGPRWPATAAAAIRRGRSGGPLRYPDLYFGTKPRARPAAFAYLYGRLDDHRYYWWKLLAARDAIALYRRDPAAFRRQWESLLPGRPKEATWYPGAADGVLAGQADLDAALRQGALVRVPEQPELRVRVSAGDPAARGSRAALRPEAAGALRLLTATYRASGGKLPLVTGDLARTASDPPLAAPTPAAAPGWPPDPGAGTLPGGGPSPDLDFHTTGLAFDLLRPAAARDWKTLEYALGILSDRHVLWWRDERGGGRRRYHVVPNPRVGQALARLAAGGPLPVLPGL